MDQLDEQLNGHQHGHGCGFCNGDPEAIIYQQQLEEGVKRFDQKVKFVTQRTVEVFDGVKKALSPLAPENLAVVVEKIDNKLSKVLVAAQERAEEQNANSQSVWASLGVKEKKALAGAAIIAAQMGVQTSVAVASETTTVPEPVKSDLEAYRTIAQAVSQEPEMAGRISEVRYSDEGVLLIRNTPVAQDSAPSNVEQLDASSNQPEQTSINYRLDLAKTTEKTRAILTKTLNLKVNEAGDEAQLERPLVRELQEGENPVSLAKAMLGPEKSKDKSTLYALSWLIVDLNDIDVEAGEDKLILAGTSLKLPLETAGSERYTVQPGDTVSAIEKKFGIEDRQGFLQNNAIINADYIEAGWELVIDSDKQPAATDVVEVAEESSAVEVVSEEEVEAVSAEVALDQIITAVESIENPKPAFVEVFDTDIEPLPTPITDSLKENRDEILNDIAEGRTDVGSVQSGAVVDLSLAHSELTPDVVARQFVSQAFEQAGLSPPTSEQIESLSAEILKGINDDNPVLDVLAQTEGIHIDTKSKLVVDIVKELETEVAARTKEVEQARQKLQTFGIEVDTSYESATKIMTEESLRGELRGDAYYYLLLDGNTTQDNVEFVRQDLTQALFSNYRAEKLLGLNEVQLEIIDATVETLSQDYINLKQYISGVEQILLERLEAGKVVAVPAIAEVAVLFDEVDKIDDEALSRLAVEAATGASADFIKMSVLEEIASLKEVTLSEVVASYYQRAFEASGLGEALSNRVQELSEETLTVWVGDDFSKSSVRLDAVEVVNSVVEEAFGRFIEDNEKYIGVASDSVQLSDELNSLIITYLNTSGDRESFDILFIKTLANNPDEATAEYLTDYYTIRGAGDYLEPGVIEAIGHAVAEDATKPSDYTETLKTYSGNPEDLFPGGMQYVLRDYDGKDLAPFFEAAGLDVQSVLANPLNENLTLKDGVLVAKDMPTIWFNDESLVNKVKLKEAYDEHVLGITPPEIVQPAPDEPNARPVAREEATSNSEKLTSGEIMAEYGGALDVQTREMFKDNGYSWEQIARLEVMLSSNVETPIPPNMVITPNSDGKHVAPESYNGAYEFWGNTPEYQRSGAFSTVKAVVMVAEQWNLLYPDNPMLIGDLDAKGHETHRVGVDTDLFVRGMLEDGRAQIHGEFTDNLALAMLLGKAGAVRILLNDEAVAKTYNHWAKANNIESVMVTTVEGHRWHMHSDWKEEWRVGVSSSQSLAPGTIMHVDVDEEARDAYDAFLRDVIEKGSTLESVLDGSLIKAETIKTEETVDKVVVEDEKAAAEETSINEISASLQELVNNVGNDEADYAYERYITPERLAEVDNMILTVAEERGMNITPQGLAGLSAHIAAESGGKIEAVGGSSTRSAEGILQWERSRKLDADGEKMEMTLRGQIEHMFYDMEAFDRNGGGSFGKPDMLNAIQDETLDLIEVVFRGYSLLLPRSFLEGGSEEEGGGNRLVLAESILDDYND